MLHVHLADLPHGVLAVEHLQAARVGDLRHLPAGVVEVGRVVGAGRGGAVGDGLGLLQDAAKHVAAVRGAAAGVGELAHVACRVVSELVHERLRCAAAKGGAGGAAQGVAGVGGGEATGVGLAGDVACGVSGVAGAAGVGAGLGHHFAKGVAGVGCGDGFGVGDAGDLDQLAPGLGGHGVVGKGGGGGAAQGVQALSGGLVQRVGAGRGFSVGVVSELAGLAGCAALAGQAVELVHRAGGELGNGAGAVFDFFACAIAHAVQGVCDAVAPVVSGAHQTLGGVINVSGRIPVGLRRAGDLAAGGVGEVGGFGGGTAAALGHAQHPPTRVVGVSGDQAIRVSLREHSPGSVVGEGCRLVQRVPKTGLVACGVVGVAADAATRVGAGGDQALGVVAPCPGARLAGGGVSDGFRQLVAQCVIGVSRGAPRLGDEHG